MPTLNLVRDHLFYALGESFTDDAFSDLCFDFGIELDEVTTEDIMLRKERGSDVDKDAVLAHNVKSEEIIYKIDIPANRYDLLSLEGLAAALRVFRGTGKIPNLRRVPSGYAGESIEIHVKEETKQIRPYIVGAVLRNISFTEESYNRFIEHQDKLHANICRKRTLVAIGTHDLDTLSPPFSYEARAPEDIRFAPLNKVQDYSAAELMELFQVDQKLKHYLHIIRDSPVYPVIYDSKGIVLSMPPIINGNHSRITLKTRNVFIECTATDLTKAIISLNMLIASFSSYCENPFEVGEVRVFGGLNEEEGAVVFPDLSWHEMAVDIGQVSRVVGVPLTAEECCARLERMMLPAEVSEDNQNILRVRVPPIRSDVLHACDVIEDVAIGYGYNNIPRTVPRTVSVGRPNELNRLTELLRIESANAGFTEILTLILCSLDENYRMLLQEDPKNQAVRIGNPKTPEFQIARTLLLPGLLKTLQESRDHPLPIQLFEISDVVVQDSSTDVGAKNERHMIACFCGRTSGFEVVHGFLDRIMQSLDVPYTDPVLIPSLSSGGSSSGAPSSPDDGYFIEREDSAFPFLFPGRSARVLCRGLSIGYMGVIHPLVLKNFSLTYPVSVLEINIESFV